MKTFEHFEKTKEKAEYIENDIELTDALKRSIMSSIDVASILESWNVQPVLRNNQWNGYCPDHFIHAGRISHAPKWTMNADTGDTTCFTGSFFSNIVYIAKRLYNLNNIKEAIDKLTNGGGVPYIPPDFILEEKRKERNELDEKKQEEKRITCIKKINRILLNKHINVDCLNYFHKSGITDETLDFLCVSSVEDGYYAGRAIIPFVNENREISGYVAVNYMGKEWMIERNINKWCKLNGESKREEAKEYFTKNYRKTLYCPGFKTRDHLYGYYEVLNGERNLDRLVVVEGERDAMKLLQEGINCVSIHGTILKEEQRILIKKINPEKLFLGFDMDDAGNKATQTAFEKLSGEIEQCYVLNFPENKDPKEFNKNELENILNYAEKNKTQSR